MFIEAKVYALFAGNNPKSMVPDKKDYLEFDFGGIVGSKYNGVSKLSDVRDRQLLHDSKFPKHIEVRNWRQWSAVSEEELAQIAKKINVPTINASLLGANLSFSEIERFTQLPKGTIIRFPDNAILLVEEENTPCINPGKEIAKVYSQIDPSHFVKAAMGLRGLVGVVYRPGVVRVGDIAGIQIYEPKHYSFPNLAS